MKKRTAKKSSKSVKKVTAKVTKKVAKKASSSSKPSALVRLRGELRDLKDKTFAQNVAANDKIDDLEAELMNIKSALANVGNVALDYIKVARDEHDYDADELDGIRAGVVQLRALSGHPLLPHHAAVEADMSTETIVTPEACADDGCTVDTSARDERLRETAQDAAEAAQQNLADLAVALVDPHVLDGANPVNEP